MRSKSKARKLNPESMGETDTVDPLLCPTDESDSPMDPEVVTDAELSRSQSATPVESRSSTECDTEGLPLPDEEFELRASGVYDGVGVWSQIELPGGQKLGPFTGILKPTVSDPASAWELVDEFGKVRGWLDASRRGTGNWMKFIRSTSQQADRNLVAVQVKDQIYYKTTKDVQPGDELLLYSRDAVYMEKDLHKAPKFLEEDRQFSCDTCGEVFRSKVALRRHETYVCQNQSAAIFANLNRDFLRGHSSSSSNNPSISLNSSLSSNSSISNHGGHSYQLGLSSHSNSSEDIDTSGEKAEMIQEDSRQDHSFDSFQESASLNLSSHFPCENCEEVFSEPNDLQLHIRNSHVGARAHACTECGKTFATSSGLKQHQHIHSTVKPFQCEVCLRAYTQFSNLCRHKRMHADCRQQIKCKDCGQAFSTTTSLSKHKRFCEGVLRNGARFGFPSVASTPSAEKTTPLVPTATQASPLMAAYMSMYSPRPPFPFYPPLGPGFPIFPPGHPLTPMTPQLLPDTKMSTSRLSAASPTSPMATPPRMASDSKDRVTSDGSEVTDMSDIGSVSDLENGASDIESEVSSTKKVNNGRKSQSPAAFVDVPKYSEPSQKRSSLSPANAKSKTPEIAHSHDKKITPPSSGEQPLDLSVKVKVTERESTSSSRNSSSARKTHIFGEKVLSPVESSTPDKKATLHSAYPMSSPMMFDQMYQRMDKQKLQSFQDATRMMALPRFPFPTPQFPPMGAMGGMGLLAPSPIDPAKLSPLMKLDRHPNPFGYNPGMTMNMNKIKDRYACKFCGKVFPRSANLTRHLRTHTGEQPYKCKYCERSFSISSNLQRHVRNIHNKEKPFKCPLCDRCFGQQTNLDRHLKKHETDGLNVVDSPEAADLPLDQEDTSLLPRSSSYYDDFHNSERERENQSSPLSNLSNSEDRESPRTNIDTQFSITAQLEKHHQLSSSSSHKKDNGSGNLGDEESLEDADHKRNLDDDEDDEEEEGLVAKKIKLDNNNSELSPKRHGPRDDYANGYLNQREMLAQYMNYGLKGVTKPLVIST